MPRTLTILQDAPPLHTQPMETLVASPFQGAEAAPERAPAQEEIHGNPYAREFKGVKIDPYRICKVYNITDPAIQHALKKLLRLGRGSEKDEENDVEEAIQSLERWQEMREEERA